jgi:hypothetical protein
MTIFSWLCSRRPNPPPPAPLKKAKLKKQNWNATPERYILQRYRGCSVGR